MRKKRMWILMGGGVILILCLAGFWLVRNGIGQAQAQIAGTGEVVTAFVGDLAAGTTATGQVNAGQSARLTLPSSGTVAEVLVQVGDEVQAGDTLLRLETAELERAVTNAEQALIIQEANLAALQEPATAVAIAAAEAAVASAQAQLDSLLAGPTEAEIASAAASVAAAQADVTAASTRLNNARNGAGAAEIQAAQIALDQAQVAATQATEQHTTILATIQDGNAPAGLLDDAELAARVNVLQANAQLAAAQETLNRLRTGNPNDVATAQASLSTAVAQRNLAQAQYDLLLAPASASQIASAEASLAQAQANLDKLRRGPTAAQRTAAEVQVENTRISLERARLNLENATLAAPFAGVITAVHVQPGELASGILVEMGDNRNLEVVLNVNEVDLRQIAVGQETLVTLETWPDNPMPGRVTAVAPTAASTVGSSLVNFPVTISLDETDLPIRVGMTANAALELARREDVLLVPNGAIQVDRSNGAYSVILVQTNAQGQPVYTTVPVTIGLRDGRYTEIMSGIQGGDQLLIPDPTAVNPFGPGGGNGSGGGPFGG
ncbi:MAG TPA: efflux RND transporter periplasmic adaptor subunit [Chloroflexota bacterium]|nr:efflux RND transporter periplasmic adaptor subunit [Chloroflexota bacterium]